MFNRKTFSYLLLVISMGVVAVAHATLDVSSSQEVYVTDEPLPQIAARLKEQGMSQEQIIKHLKATLPKITPELAQDKFNIEWLDNNLSAECIKSIIEDLKFYHIAQDMDQAKRLPYVYPAVAICYMGPEVGYGLFALDGIKRGDIIAEYAGKHIKDRGLYKKNSYSAYISNNLLNFEAVDASRAGNVARFAQHLSSEEELYAHGYDFFNKPYLAMANSGLMSGYYMHDRCLAFVAITDIHPFEQIGYSYDGAYGYEGTVWPEEPYLFDKMGAVVSADKYQITHVGILLLDQMSIDQIGNSILLNPHPKGTLNSDINSLISCLRDALGEDAVSIVDEYLLVKVSDEEQVIVNPKAWQEQIVKPRSRITIPSYWVDYGTDLKKFIALLKDIDNHDNYALSKESLVKILNEAKKNNYQKSRVLKFMALIKELDNYKLGKEAVAKILHEAKNGNYEQVNKWLKLLKSAKEKKASQNHDEL